MQFIQFVILSRGLFFRTILKFLNLLTLLFGKLLYKNNLTLVKIDTSYLRLNDKVKY